MRVTSHQITLFTIAACLFVLAADRIYGRFFDRMPSRVYVMGGNMSVSMDGGYLDNIRSINEIERLNYTELAPLNTPLEVKVTGGKLDYPTNFQGKLIVSQEN